MKKIENNSINLNNLNEKVELYGWVNKKRDLGGVIFIDLRDRSGIIQLIVKPDNSSYSKAIELKNEAVIRTIGIVKERENKNKNIPTGDIEIEVEEIEILSNIIGTKVNELFQLVLSSNAAESENNSNALIIVKYTPKGGSEATIINGTGSVESGQVAHVTPGMKYNITFDYKDGVVQTISIEQQ